MKTLILFVSLCWMPVAWADYQRTPATRFDMTELGSEINQAIPTLSGCDDTHGVVTCRRKTGEFTEAEVAAMDAVLAAHDPDIAAKRQAKRKADRASGDAKLKALGLTNAELDALKTR